ncbi:hypothetical protein [Terrimonas pollutisoli]|uniref:hypothetical protein n=1 Tax=Terrimonas pollutisoli TaxID=3034147 RepID=UPI0023EC5007|nr:hypothetical protein [Terrimonas sp. H1YJ31]
MSYSKEFIDALLAAGPEYSKEKILDFKPLPNTIPTRQYSDFIYGSVSNPDNPFRIEPFCKLPLF